MLWTRKILGYSALITVWAGIAISLLGCTEKSSVTEVPRRLEEARATSPNGQLDAVMVREDAGGAAGGWEWNVYIVAKGNAVLRSSHPIFYAGTLTGEKLIWAQEHLLEIHYDIADIHVFRNLWALDEIQKVETTLDHDYLVEIRLVPSSPDFSLLTTNGDFKPKN